MKADKKEVKTLKTILLFVVSLFLFLILSSVGLPMVNTPSTFSVAVGFLLWILGAAQFAWSLYKIIKLI